MRLDSGRIKFPEFQFPPCRVSDGMLVTVRGPLDTTASAMPRIVSIG